MATGFDLRRRIAIRDSIQKSLGIFPRDSRDLQPAGQGTDMPLNPAPVCRQRLCPVARLATRVDA
jgi:hypothetical protein